MTDIILVTGATGTVGQNVVAALTDRDLDVRIGARDPESVPESIATAGRVVECDFTRPETWGPALNTVDGLFVLRPPAVDRSAIESFVAAADRVGVARIAYLSTIGADRNLAIPHHWIEKRIIATSMAHTLLRASFFMQNLVEVHRRDIVAHDEIFVPAGDGATSFIDARDVGEAAARVLTEPGHANRAYDLTGPAALTYGDVADIFSDVLDRPISYPAPSLLAFARRMHSRGTSLGMVALMCEIYTTARLGLADRVTDDTATLLDRPPRDMRTFVRDYEDEFRPEARSDGSSASGAER